MNLERSKQSKYNLVKFFAGLKEKKKTDVVQDCVGSKRKQTALVQTF
jgi:hypothetical protein